FSLTLIIGIIIGTYSSIYVAAPIVVIWKDVLGRRKLAAVPAAAPRAAAAPAPRPAPASPAPRPSAPASNPSSGKRKKNRR
ncbi:MAG: protein translocase subunit SecF, partial [Acidobacteria bacterium]|nr:protein translocase subunit SecF [Acidobacteriota bacterium]